MSTTKSRHFSSMAPLPSGGGGKPPIEEPDAEGNVWQTHQDSILASSFQPPFVHYPKPWHRVRVPPATNRRQSKIWKRIAGLRLGLENPDYILALAELEDQGLGSRKRCRPSNYVPALGDIRWDSKIQGLVDGQRDLEEARERVRTTTEDTKALIETTVQSIASTSTFPDLTWVPRKRLSTRWPVEPRSNANKAKALHPPVDFTPVASSEPKNIRPSSPDVSHAERRVRRASRRLSMFPSCDIVTADDEPPRSVSALSPTKKALGTASSVEFMGTQSTESRFAIGSFNITTGSPEEGVDSQATSEMNLESTSMTTSPAKLERTTSIPQTMQIPTSLVFDQPLPQTPVQSASEIKRRLSLHSALGSDRGNTSASKKIPAKLSEDVTRRRHSSVFSTNVVKEPKSRRRTVDPSFTVAGRNDAFQRTLSNPTDEPDSSLDFDITDASLGPEPTLVVDVGTNLDIFGQKPLAKHPSGKTSTRPREISTDHQKSASTHSRTDSSMLDSVFGTVEQDTPQVVATFDDCSMIYEEVCLEDKQTELGNDEELLAQPALLTMPAPEQANSLPPSPNSVTGSESEANDCGSTSSDALTSSAPGEPGPSHGIREILDQQPISPWRESLQTTKTMDIIKGTTPPSTPPFAVERLKPSPALCDDEERILDTPPDRLSGFTPINLNGPSISPSSFSPTTEEFETTNVEGTEVMGSHIVHGETAIVMDDLADDLEDGIIPIEEEDTLTDQAVSVFEEDSETEMLRKFVTRVRADKSAKAAEASDALAKRKLRAQRHSGSLGSTTSSTGSPMNKAPLPLKRRPLGERDLNSPSPRKRRKPDEGDHIFKGKAIFSSEEISPRPKQKRRRKRLDSELETTLETSVSQLEEPEADSASGPRRSTRARNTRISTRNAAQNATSSAFSMIPVRLPGQSGMLGDLGIEISLGASRQRSEEKELGAVTRVNTRKNKGDSIPAKMMLARQKDDPNPKMQDLLDVFDTKENPDANATEKTGPRDGRVSRKENRVRWAETLASYQGEETAAIGSSVGDATTNGAAVEESPLESDAIPTATTSEPSEPAPPKQTSKRPRTSKLQPPTPIKKVTLSEPKSAASHASHSLKPMAASARGMATRRTKIASLGMGINGTPAPKRRTKPMA